MATYDKRWPSLDDFVKNSKSRRCPHVYVTDDSSRSSALANQIVATFACPHPMNVVVSADGTRVYVTGYDSSTSIISTADNTVTTFVLDRSTAEVVSPDRNHI
jgi:DNA-binding beta-propeller fold protein YncE